MTGPARIDPMVVSVTIRVVIVGPDDNYLFQLSGIPDEPMRSHYCVGLNPRDEVYAQIWKAIRDIPACASVQISVLGVQLKWPYRFTATQGTVGFALALDVALNADARIDHQEDA